MLPSRSRSPHPQIVPQSPTLLLLQELYSLPRAVPTHFCSFRWLTLYPTANSPAVFGAMDGSHLGRTTAYPAQGRGFVWGACYEAGCAYGVGGSSVRAGRAGKVEPSGTRSACVRVSRSWPRRGGESVRARQVGSACVRRGRGRAEGGRRWRSPATPWAGRAKEPGKGDGVRTGSTAGAATKLRGEAPRRRARPRPPTRAGVPRRTGCRGRQDHRWVAGLAGPGRRPTCPRGTTRTHRGCAAGRTIPTTGYLTAKAQDAGAPGADDARARCG